MGRRTRTSVALLAATVLALFVGASSASASFHLVKIRSIFRGPNDPAGAFIELQMYADGQNLLNGHNLNLWNSTMGAGMFITLNADAQSGQSQRTVLIRDDASALPADFKINGLGNFLTANAAGGIACWETIDCVAWGGFSGGSPPSPVGTPIVGGLLSSKVSVRDISRGCPTALDEADDTNDSNTDFQFLVHPPRTNLDAPTETLCPSATPPGNPTSSTNPAGNTRKRKCKKKQKSSGGAYAAKKKKCKRKRK